MSDLRWVSLKKPIIRGKRNRIVLRFTEGDSEWLNATSKKFIMVVKSHPWDDDAVSAVDIIKRFYGEIPDENEPGRIVFNMPASDCVFNENRKRYYCKIYSSTSADFTNNILAFQGYFEVKRNTKYNDPLGGN